MKPSVSDHHPIPIGLLRFNWSSGIQASNPNRPFFDLWLRSNRRRDHSKSNRNRTFPIQRTGNHLPPVGINPRRHGLPCVGETTGVANPAISSAIHQFTRPSRDWRLPELNSQTNFGQHRVQDSVHGVSRRRHCPMCPAGAPSDSPFDSTEPDVKTNITKVVEAPLPWLTWCRLQSTERGRDRCPVTNYGRPGQLQSQSGALAHNRS
jgi:hypothetical protein